MTLSRAGFAYRTFLNEGELRAGWRLAAYVLLLVLLVSLIRGALPLLGITKFWSPLVGEAGALGATCLATLVMGAVERRSWGVYGLPMKRVLVRMAWVGAGWGLAGVSLLIVTLSAVGVLDFGGVALRGPAVAGFAAFWALMFLLVGLFEELLFRGYAQFTLARGIGFWPAAVALSVLFGGSHLSNQGESWVGALATAGLGLFVCWTLRRTGTLWFAIGFHAAFDWGESFLYSVPDSGQVVPGHLLNTTLHGPVWLTGGSVGPEGSVVCLAVIGLLWVAFRRVYGTVS